MNCGFIYLTAFSSIGGIQKFNKAFLKALGDIKKEDINFSYNALSLHDQFFEKQYIDESHFKGLNGKNLSFLFETVKLVLKSDLIVFGHINLYLIGFLCYILQKKYIVVTHGIEVWGKNNYFKRLFLKKAHKILSVSNFTKDRLVENYGLKPEKIHIVFNTIGPFFESSFTNTGFKDNIENENSLFTILTVCRLSSQERYKGYDKVIEAISQLSESYEHIKYIIAGKSDNNEKKRIADLIHSLDMENKVHLAGEVNECELKELYESSQLFILPSKGEGFGIVFLEALYYGLPVIAGNKDGSVDPLLQGKLGTLVDPDDIEGISKAIVNIISNKKLRSVEHKEFLRNQVVENFGYQKFCQNIKGLLYEH